MRCKVSRKVMVPAPVGIAFGNDASANSGGQSRQPSPPNSTFRRMRIVARGRNARHHLAFRHSENNHPNSLNPNPRTPFISTSLTQCVCAGRYRTNVWDDAGVNTMRADRLQDLATHPTVKPVALVADAIKDCSRRSDIVLDPFAGSGTTLIAAQKTGRRARVMEIDPSRRCCHSPLAGVCRSGRHSPRD